MRVPLTSSILASFWFVNLAVAQSLTVVETKESIVVKLADN